MLDLLLAYVLPPLIGAAATTLLGLGGVAIHRLADLLRLKADDQVRVYLQDVLARAIAFAEAEARRRLPNASADGAVQRIADATTEIAADYVRDRVPDALARFKVTDRGLAEMIQARLPSRLLSRG